MALFTSDHLRRAAQLSCLMLVACSSVPPSQNPDAGDHAAHAPGFARPGVPLAAPAPPPASNLNPLPDLSGPTRPVPLRSLGLTNPAVVALKVLILTAPNDYGLSSARTMLDQAGVPYDVIDPTVTPLTTDSLIAQDGSGRYQGVILTSGNLAFEASPGVWQSALDWGAWNLLWQYETTYQARQLALYTYPGSWPEDYGLRDAGVASPSADLRLTAAGQSVFQDIRAGATLPVRYAYNYPATTVEVNGVTTTPLLTDPAGRVLAAQSNTEGRERLALTFAQNPNLLHTALLNDSLLSWLTRGVYIGEYRRYNQLDVDDWFLPGDVFNETTGQVQPEAFRLRPSDALALPAQQRTLRTTYPVTAGFKLAVMFNGGGANTAAPASCNASVVSPDPLSSVTRCLTGTFDWVNHTFDHLYMDFLNLTDSAAQVQNNLNVGTAMGLSMSRASLVTGDMSGLGYYNAAGDGPKTNYGLGASNTAFLQAAQNSGVKYLSSNRSVDGQWDPGCAGCGLPHPLRPSVFLVPRWPTNIFYHVTTPAQVAAAYNSVYGPGGTAPFWDRPLSYQEILDQEGQIALTHVLSGAAFPHYMHQGNLREYAPGRSVVFDWEMNLVGRYAAYSTMPLKNLNWDALGAYVKSRTSFMKSGLSGSWNRQTRVITVRSANGGAGYLTGVTLGRPETYAGRIISRFDMTAGQTATVPAP
ncbi:hypothetical protein [Deinococcus sp. 12RED42]|uniref:Agd3-related carbohydrate-binding protein n=1 Tax=Deinococcus sp. 12RED42 TaxID=2745872 RepID=UPI001E404821|nr:hypothetical protein [Deinococcus sp. 12RED42]MCD0165343.1 hypothetical protein [Deinococcus sp. 12RED42]